MPFVFGVPRFLVAPSGHLMKMSGGATVLCHTVENILAALAVCSIHHEKHSALVFAFSFFFFYINSNFYILENRIGEIVWKHKLFPILFLFFHIFLIHTSPYNVET